MAARNSGRLAFCGMMAALAMVFLLLTVIPVTEISLAALAGIAGVPVIIESGKRSGALVYVSVSVLALLLVPAIEGKALYIAFFGYYPILKALLEEHCRRPVEWMLKLLVFNTAVCIAYWVMLTFFHLDSDAFVIGGVSLPWVFLLLGNVVFVLYDWGLSRLIGRYLVSWQPRIRRLFRF